jgi:hypothetical protein
MSAEDLTPCDVLIEAAIAEVDLHLPAELHIADRTDVEARELRPGRFAFATGRLARAVVPWTRSRGQAPPAWN